MLEATSTFFEDGGASLRVNVELRESFCVDVGVRQRCVMSPWLIYEINESQSGGYR